MTKKYYETEEFKRLQSEWYNKLNSKPVKERHKKKYGVEFSDVEPDDTLEIQPEIFTLPTIRKETKHGTPGYYDLCHAILRRHEEVEASNDKEFKRKNRIFKTEVHRRIFEYHTEGKTREQIVELIRKEFKQSYSPRNVSYLIQTIEDRYIFGRKQ